MRLALVCEIKIKTSGEVERRQSEEKSVQGRVRGFGGGGGGVEGMGTCSAMYIRDNTHTNTRMCVCALRVDSSYSAVVHVYITMMQTCVFGGEAVSRGGYALFSSSCMQ